MSKTQARKTLQELKHGLTVKEFLRLCDDMGGFFDDILGTDLEILYRALTDN